MILKTLRLSASPDDSDAGERGRTPGLDNTQPHQLGTQGPSGLALGSLPAAWQRLCPGLQPDSGQLLSWRLLLSLGKSLQRPGAPPLCLSGPSQECLALKLDRSRMWLARGLTRSDSVTTIH